MIRFGRAQLLALAAVAVAATMLPTTADPRGPSPDRHDRNVWLILRGHLNAQGRVVSGAFPPCRDHVEVKIQRSAKRGWRKVAKVETDEDGGYRTALSDRAGRYRALASETTLSNGTDICEKAASVSERHRHRH